MDKQREERHTPRAGEVKWGDMNKHAAGGRNYGFKQKK